MAVSSRAIAVAAGDSQDVLLSVCPPNAADRLPCDMCVVVDVSGSMQQVAIVKTAQEEGAPELSVLDIVRHAVKTVVHTLGDGDRLAIVAYSDKASTVLELTAMSGGGKSAAEEALQRLHADGQTNLWDGLQTGMELLRRAARPGASAAVLLLTDGVPNVEPPGGHLPALQKYRRDQGSKLPGTLHTFGFGKDLDSKLLNDLACEGDGMYVFIPDAGFVGTALVNCMANTLVTMGRNAQLTVEPLEGCRIEHVYGHKGVTGGELAIVPLGSLQFGQTSDIVVRMAAPSGHTGPRLRATLRYDGAAGPGTPMTFGDVPVAAPGSPKAREATAQLHRLRLVELLDQLLVLAGPAGEGLELAGREVASFVASLEGGDQKVRALQEDVEGQVCEAVSRKDWYTGWGAHYLRSLARAHFTQQCNNFKDPGVQVYGGQLFEQVRERADETFLALPPPSQHQVGHIQLLTAMGFPESDAQRALQAAGDDPELAATYLMEGIPSHPRPAARRSGHGTAAPAPAYSMRAYYDSAGPCFSGLSIAALADGGERRMAELRKGDRVATGDGGWAEVLCVVKTRTRGQALLVELAPGLQATPWHPVQLESGEWAFPARVGIAAEQPCPAVYNVVLDRGHTLFVGGLRTVSLGHGLQGEVLGHSFWGGSAVLESLQRIRGWAEGRVVLGPGCVLRDELGHACGLCQATDEEPQ